MSIPVVNLRCEELPAATITRFLQRALLAAHPLGTPPSTPDKAQSASSSVSGSSTSSDDDNGEKTTTTDRPFALATLRELSLRGLRVSDEGARAIGEIACVRSFLPASCTPYLYTYVDYSHLI